MATGDAAYIAGMDLVAGTDDRRNGWEEINKTRDYVATQTVAASRITGVLDAARVPSLNASKITAGTLATARIPALAASKITSGVLAVAQIPGLPASKITSGDLDLGRIPLIPRSKLPEVNTALAALAAEIADIKTRLDLLED